jgi:hypothetical protein
MSSNKMMHPEGVPHLGSGALRLNFVRAILEFVVVMIVE